MDDASAIRELLISARAGDQQATDQLLARVRPWLQKAARTFADPHQPEASVSDLVQEAWLRAWQKLDQFQGAGDEAETQAQFRAWLERIVERLGLNAVRDRNAQQRKPPGKLVRLHERGFDESGANALQPAAQDEPPSARLQAEERTRLIRAALANIEDEVDRLIIRQRFFEGTSLRQIAEGLGTNHEAVRQRYHAVLRRLERELEGLV